MCALRPRVQGVDLKDANVRENRYTKPILAAAANTYKTVRLSPYVGELLSDCEKAFQALRQLRLPRQRAFQNLQLKGELKGWPSACSIGRHKWAGS
jgi:hypothetical protein